MKNKYIFISLTFIIFIISLCNVNSVENSFCLDNNTLITNITINITTDGNVSTRVLDIMIPCPFGCNPSLGKCNQSPYLMNSSPIFDALAIIFFLGNLGVMFLKTYNVTKIGKGYEKIFIFITMIFSFMSWLIMIAYFSFRPGLDTSFWQQTTSLIMYVNFFLMILEVIVIWTTSILEKRPKVREKKTLFPRL